MSYRPSCISTTTGSSDRTAGYRLVLLLLGFTARRTPVDVVFKTISAGRGVPFLHLRQLALLGLIFISQPTEEETAGRRRQGSLGPWLNSAELELSSYHGRSGGRPSGQGGMNGWVVDGELGGSARLRYTLNDVTQRRRKQDSVGAVRRPVHLPWAP